MKFPFEIPATAEFDVVGFGTNAVDHLIQVPEYPAFDSKIEFLQYAKDAGGEVATTLVGLQRLGLRTAYAGRFGDDAEGELGLDSLAAEGVDTTYTERVADASTQIAFILIDRRTGERTIIWHRDERLAYDINAAPVAAAASCKVLHMTPHDVDACAKMARSAKENGAVVSVDIDSAFEGLDRLLPLVDVLIASRELPRAITGLPDHKPALRAIQERYGCGVVGATMGRAGSILFCGEVGIDTDAFDVPGGCVDTTGAGDAFRTGFLYGMLIGENPKESARIANAAAALSCRMLGARAGLPTQDELTLFIKKRWT
jgi:sulfofructose kinase